MSTSIASIAPAFTSPRITRVGDVGDQRQLADQALALADPLERLRALRRQAFRDRPVARYSVTVRRAVERGGRGAAPSAAPRRAARDNSRRSIRSAGAAARPAAAGHRRRDQVAQPIVADLGVGRHPLGLPDHAERAGAARAARRRCSRVRPHPARHPVVERAEGGVEEEDAGASHAPLVRVPRQKGNRLAPVRFEYGSIGPAGTRSGPNRAERTNPLPRRTAPE